MTSQALVRFFKGKKVLITGHTGFKGSWLCRILLNLGADVAGYSLPPGTEPNLYSALGLQQDIRSTLADIRDYARLSAVFDKEKPEIVLHLAAQPLVRPSYDDPLYTFSTNVMGTVNVLECTRQSKGVKAAVIITTDKVYESKGIVPHKETDELGGYDPYSSSKVCAEHVTRCYIRSFFNPQNQEPKTFIASARAGNIIGGGDWSKDRIVPDIVRAVLEKKEAVIIRNPSSIRPWQHVLDPLFGYLLLAKKLYEKDKSAVGAWNFAPSKENFISVEELAKLSIKHLGKGSYSVKPEEGKHETAVLKLDATKARDSLGWRPLLGIEECVGWAAEWYNDFYSGKGAKAITARQIALFMERVRYS